MNTLKTLWQTQHALIVTLLGLAVAPLSAKFGIQVDPAVIYSTVGLIAAYVVGHHYKEAAITAAKIAAGIVDQIPAPPAPSPATTKAIVAALLVGALAAPAPAKAQALFSSGPTLPLMEVRPGNPHPVSLAAGAGYQLNLTFAGLQKAIGGKSWDLLALNGMVFGSAVSSSSGSTFGALSAALGVCTLSSLLCIGGGHDLITSNGTLGGWFGLFAFSINFGLGPTAPPAGVDHGPLGLPRANTLFFGAP